MTKQRQRQLTPEEWSHICSHVVDQMNEHVRPFVVPLSNETESEVRLVGTGTFIRKAKSSTILTCEHVVREEPLNFRPYGGEEVYSYCGNWEVHHEPIDAAWTTGLHLTPELPARVVQPHQIAKQHNPSQSQELFFFYGYSGENSVYAFDTHMTNGTGYLTQLNCDAASDSGVIELLWPNGKQDWSEGTTPRARSDMRFSDPAGFSGSLVWNTRFLETGADLKRWTPEQAVATALLKRFVPEDKVLLATPIDAVRSIGGFGQERSN
jgi:hypothetical protein